MQVADPALEMHAFLVTRWTGEPANIEPEEHDGLRWFRPRELTSLNLAHPENRSSILSMLEALAAGQSVS